MDQALAGIHGLIASAIFVIGTIALAWITAAIGDAWRYIHRKKD